MSNTIKIPLYIISMLILFYIYLINIEAKTGALVVKKGSIQYFLIIDKTGI